MKEMLMTGNTGLDYKKKVIEIYKGLYLKHKNRNSTIK